VDGAGADDGFGAGLGAGVGEGFGAGLGAGLGAGFGAGFGIVRREVVGATELGTRVGGSVVEAAVVGGAVVVGAVVVGGAVVAVILGCGGGGSAVPLTGPQAARNSTPATAAAIRTPSFGRIRAARSPARTRLMEELPSCRSSRPSAGPPIPPTDLLERYDFCDGRRRRIG
jgi:hypothetical protein